MFTGIVTEIGSVRALTSGPGDLRLEIAAPRTAAGLALGASVACAGCCLTAVALAPDGFAADVSAETLARTTLGSWRAGTRLNLERALRAGDELGGHIVSGHVDAVADIVGWAEIGGSVRAEFAVAASFGRFLAPKGSVCLDGVSLTVNEVADDAAATRFTVNLIAHTRHATTFGEGRVGRRVNLEVDMLARYVARLDGR